MKSKYGSVKYILDSYYNGWVEEHKFHPTRKWRFDLAHLELKIAIEFEGGLFIMGRHVRGRQYINDMEKYNTAQIMGWKVLRYTPDKEGITKLCNDMDIIFKKEDICRIK